MSEVMTQKKASLPLTFCLSLLGEIILNLDHAIATSNFPHTPFNQSISMNIEKAISSFTSYLLDSLNFLSHREALHKPTLKSAEASSNNSKCRRFSLNEIKEATNNFDQINVLGRGGEGKVYRGRFKLDSTETTTLAAVKHLTNSAGFEQEIKTMSEIQHPNVLFLIGYCDEQGWNILVYEFMENGNLARYTTRNFGATFLSWSQWLNICLGAALGLQHLHNGSEAHPKGIIHRDIKPHNILLDGNWVAKISDFGLFKLSHAGQDESATVTNIKGTGGYYAPEYLQSQRITRKIDVYSFGVVLFQVLCGKSPWFREDESYDATDDQDLTPWAMQNVHPEFRGQISDDCLKAFTEIIGKCLKTKAKDRPTMDDVVLALQTQLKCIKNEDQVEEPARESEQRSTGSRPKGSTSSSSRLQLSSSSIAEYDSSNPIVIDVGGAIIKAGFAGDTLPRTFDASQVGLTNPIKDGMVSGWDDYRRIVRHALYKELKCDPNDEQHPILLTEPPLKHYASDSQKTDYRRNRENMTEVMFDEFNVPALYIGMQPVLSLLANGRKTGIVVESGDSISYSVPICDGHALPHAITGLNLAGRGLTEHLAKLLNRAGYSFSTQADYEIVRDIKEEMAYIALNYKVLSRGSRCKEKTYTLPDGKLISVFNERIKCPEALFSPSMVKIDEPGIHESIYDSIKLCDEEIWKKLYATIVVSGGTTMVYGFGQRIEKEVRELAPWKTEVNVLAQPKRMYGAWFGGSVLASLNTFPKMWISKEEYQEFGAAIVHSKCF